MIEYIISHNPDDRVLVKADKILNSGGLICFPTDTSWILAASAGSKNGIEKLYKVKKEGKEKHFSLLCNDISKASEVALINNQAFRVLKKVTPGHYTFIFEATKKISKHIQASKIDKEVGLRFVPSVLVNKLIETHGEVLVSTNIPNSMLELSEDSTEPIYSYQVEENISHLIEMIIDPGEIEFVGQSTIVDFSKPEGATLIREGAGDASLFL
jgi:tRNA threonylcarbamoyl adenosine modification protein (Sua5/YciO/YrdC/YwlC family)